MLKTIKHLNIKIIFVLLLVLAFCVVLYPVVFQNRKNADFLMINEHKFYIEMVNTPEKMANGLGGREELCDDCGMLFVFSKSSRHSFWMRGMRFPLDFVWIANGQIIDIDKNIPFNYSSTLEPDGPVDKVLEVNAGTVDKYEIKKGDRVIF